MTNADTAPSASRNEGRKHVLIVYTGGTVGMRRGPRGFCPEPGFLGQHMAGMPELEHERMPTYEIVELDPILDSANMCPADWVRIGDALLANYDRCDGFVVLHGTDTMAYSASALSFMFDYLSKPVVFTGSQIPLEELRNDARENLITSLLIAAHEPVPEVCLYFGERLLRGNRASKVSTSGFQAFEAPNFPPLGHAGVEIQIHWQRVWDARPGPLTFTRVGEPSVANIHLFPGFSAATLEQFLAPPIQGAVLHTYGAGNAPNDAAFLAVLGEAAKRGVVVVNCSQCFRGPVDMHSYATGRGLSDAGVISGADMTPEAALTKLFYLLSLGLATSKVRSLMQQNLRGELTPRIDEVRRP